MQRLKMWNGSKNRLNKTTPAIETYVEDAVESEYIVREFEIQRERWLLTTAADVAIYETSESPIPKPIQQLFSKPILKLKRIISGSYIHAYSYFGSMEAKFGLREIVPSAGEVHFCTTFMLWKHRYRMEFSRCRIATRLATECYMFNPTYYRLPANFKEKWQGL